MRTNGNRAKGAHRRVSALVLLLVVGVTKEAQLEGVGGRDPGVEVVVVVGGHVGDDAAVDVGDVGVGAQPQDHVHVQGTAALALVSNGVVLNVAEDSGAAEEVVLQDVLKARHERAVALDGGVTPGEAVAPGLHELVDGLVLGAAVRPSLIHRQGDEEVGHAGLAHDGVEVALARLEHSGAVVDGGGHAVLDEVV